MKPSLSGSISSNIPALSACAASNSARETLPSLSESIAATPHLPSFALSAPQDPSLALSAPQDPSLALSAVPASCAPSRLPWASGVDANAEPDRLSPQARVAPVGGATGFLVWVWVSLRVGGGPGFGEG